MGLGIFCVDHLNCCLTAGFGAFCFSEGRILWGSWFGYKVSRYDGRRGTFSFSRKIYKLALALVSGTWSRVFQFTQFTMGCECQSKLQICSSERNVPLLPVDWKTKGATNPIDWNKHKNTLLNHLMISHGIYT